MAPRDQREVSSDEDSAPAGDLRRGPWTVEEDLLLVNYIAAHGEGRWNALARCAGLRRTGKSCRLRWLNYLRPDLRRGNITAQEQLLILELHSRWGNRWSKIAQHLPGRTDNEIKNYWRTRVQKHARQLNCDVNSQRFKDLIRYLWMPRLLERIAGSGSGDDAQQQQQQQQLPAAAWPVDDVELSCTTTDASSSSPSVSTSGTHHHHQQQQLVQAQHQLVSPPPPPPPPPPAAPSAAFGESAPSGNTDSNNSTAAVWDTLYCQPPPPPTTAAAETACSWSDESLLGDMGMGLPELGDDTMLWGAAGADDLWYTQIMGL